MGPHDYIAIEGEKFKEKLWTYLDEHPVDNAQKAKDLMNALLDEVDFFLENDGNNYDSN